MYPVAQLPNIEPFEIVELRLTETQKDFLDKHKICISDAYLGLLRAYWNNQVIWQTSAMDVFFGLKPGMGGDEFEEWDKSNQESLRRQLHGWLDKIMNLKVEDLEKVFSNNYHLFDFDRK